jgi:hypothetical protein
VSYINETEKGMVTFSLFTDKMTLIREAVESLIGSMDFWPQYILLSLFGAVSAPHITTHCLFYGNGVPCHLAVQLYCV